MAEELPLKGAPPAGAGAPIVVGVVHYGDPASTLDLVRHLGSTRNGLDLTVHVFNNGPIESSALQESLPPDTMVIDSGGNIGYGAAANLGIQTARQRRARFFLLANNDSLVAGGSIRSLISVAEQHGAGIAAPLVTYQDGETIWAEGLEFSEWLGFARNTHKGANRSDQAAQVRLAQYVSACVLLFDLHRVPETLLFDEDYFLYYEDVDLCYRARRSGVRIVLASGVVAQHRKPRQAGYRFPGWQEYHMARSGAIFWAKWTRGTRRVTHLLGYLLMCLYRMIRADSVASALQAVRGAIDGFRAGRRT